MWFRTKTKRAIALTAAAANYPGQRSDPELKSGIQGTYIYAMATSVFLAIEGRLQTDPQNPATKIVIDTEDKEAARTAYHQAMEQEFFLSTELLWRHIPADLEPRHFRACPWVSVRRI